jgi:hypothetical protein
MPPRLPLMWFSTASATSRHTPSRCNPVATAAQIVQCPRDSDAAVVPDAAAALARASVIAVSRALGIPSRCPARPYRCRREPRVVERRYDCHVATKVTPPVPTVRRRRSSYSRAALTGSGAVRPHAAKRTYERESNPSKLNLLNGIKSDMIHTFLHAGCSYQQADSRARVQL